MTTDPHNIEVQPTTSLGKSSASINDLIKFEIDWEFRNLPKSIENKLKY